MELNETQIAQLTDSDVFQQWRIWQDRAKYATTAERTLRAVLINRLFPEQKEGSQNAVRLLTLGAEQPTEVKFTVKQQVDRKVDRAILENIKQAPEMVGVSFDRVIREVPELAVREYKALTDEQRQFFDQCLTIKFSSAQLETKEL